MKFKGTLIVVKDCNEALKFYQDMFGFADYVFIGSTLSDGISFTLSSGNKRLEYDISVSE